MKKQLKRRSLAESEELLPVLSHFISEIPSDMILQLFTDWDRRLWYCFLMKGEYIEENLNLMQFLTGLDKPASRVRPIDTHHVRQ
jgi:hypothetical protein